MLVMFLEYVNALSKKSTEEMVVVFPRNHWSVALNAAQSLAIIIQLSKRGRETRQNPTVGEGKNFLPQTEKWTEGQWRTSR